MKTLIFPLAAAALVGACAPYPPHPAHPQVPHAPTPDSQQALTDEEQRQIEENRRRLERERRERELAGNDRADTPKPPTSKPKYPTASAVPGKAGFVFNPYTHNIVDVKGIASGKLVRDPEDNDPTHKFRVP